MATTEATTDLEAQKFVSLEYWAARWNVNLATLKRRAKTDPEFPKIHRLGPRISRASLAEIESYEQRRVQTSTLKSEATESEKSGGQGSLP